MNTSIEPVASGNVTSPSGFQASAVSGGIKAGSVVLDIGVLVSSRPCNAAGVFTTNRIKAAPVLFNRNLLPSSAIRAVVANSGCANACTGQEGVDNTARMASLTAASLGLPENSMLVCSTGVIGIQLPMQRISRGIESLVPDEDGGHLFARAIMTTDTVPKEAAVKVQGKTGEFFIGGCSKGSGMIHPNMGTMLAFLTTDASVEQSFLEESLRKAVDCSFNMITVDGDTSTNDTALLMANGLAGTAVINAHSPDAVLFQSALALVCTELAKKMARDGEGATRLIEVTVEGAPTVEEARQVARTVTGSSLVKTAVYGNDPNWGRVIAAAGRSGVPVIEEKTDLYMGGICVFRQGLPQSFVIQDVVTALKQEMVHIRIGLNLGTASATAWGCDMTEEYVRINAEYTT